MPNLKLFVEEGLFRQSEVALRACLGPLRDLILDRLQLPAAACQLAVLPVMAMPDQPGTNVELHVLPAPARTREHLTALGAEMAGIVGAATGSTVAVRIAQLDPATYVVLREGHPPGR